MTTPYLTLRCRAERHELCRTATTNRCQCHCHWQLLPDTHQDQDT